MKKLLPLLLLLFSGMAKAQIVNIPDPEFKAYLLSASFTNNIAVNSSFTSSKIDINNDGEIQESEAADIVRLWIEGIQITDVQGLEAFSALEEVTIKGTSLTSFGLDMPLLPKLQITQNPVLASVIVAGMPNLNQLDCNFNPVLTSVNASNCDLLAHAALNNNYLATLNLSNHPGLVNLYCQNNQLTSLNINNCINLQGILVSNNHLTSIDVSGLTHLLALDAGYNVTLNAINASGCTSLNSSALNLENIYSITTANMSNCSSLTNISFGNNQLNSLNVTGCTNLLNLELINNQLTALDLTGCTSLNTLNLSANLITSLDLTMCTSLQGVYVNDNPITNLNMSGLTSLVNFGVLNTPLSVLNISGCTALETANTGGTQHVLTSLNAQGCISLTSLYIESSILQSLNIQGCTALTNITAEGIFDNHAPISVIDLSDAPNLVSLNVSYTSILSLDLSANNELQQLWFPGCPIQSIDLVNLPNLMWLNIAGTPIQSIDASNQSGLQGIIASDCSQLQSIFAKNGANESIGLNETDTALLFICQDEEFVNETQNNLTSMGLNVACNSYCSATPGGNFNIIGGIVRFDADNNGCNGTDIVQPNMKININDGTVMGSTFTDAAGVYVLYTGAGNFDVTLGIENPSLFNVTPATPTIIFADNANNVAAQNFCITANGSQNDAEIVIAPIGAARPGFSALYQIVIKNKGNQTLNGSFNFAFDDTLMDFVVATTAVTSQSTGMLNWNYTNLLPFENRSVYVLMNVNSPTQTPPVNQDDVLEFTATVNPIVNDINATDNQFVYQQTVVSSFDPNDITCMEGETLSPQDIGKYLHYVINFENTGTYAAEQVVVKVMIDDTKYDINTLQLLNTSHNVRPVIRGNTAEFFFEDINLAATAGDPPVGGHGNILFKIKTLSTLVTGDEVITKADIFFDYNFPIATNEARSVFETLSAPGVTKDQSIILYPNPAKNFMTIECDNIIRSISIYDVQGRALETLTRDSNAVMLDISNRAKGMYFVKIMTDKGIQVQKIVKE